MCVRVCVQAVRYSYVAASELLGCVCMCVCLCVCVCVCVGSATLLCQGR